MHVMTIKDEDYDDIDEGINAKVIYSIEKNAIEEDTGLLIFDINPDTGLITTAVCCLDREKTPDYSLQIVATDGGAPIQPSYIHFISLFGKVSPVQALEASTDDR
uniref:Cadherin domain-containing protein n=1 Tax=Anopheles merus TaxID=30066 RepID=A0A182V0Q2_ANOME